VKTKMLFSKRAPTTKEQIIKEVEKSIQLLYDDSILSKHKGELTSAKEKCLLALEKLTDMKKKNVEYFNTELEFGIRLNLALIYEALGLWDEAKQTYLDILQQDYYSPGVQFQRVRVNLGNLFYQQRDYKKALTEWKKAVDKISKENKELRAAILKNIANAHIKMGNYTDAIDNYSESMKLNPDVKTTMNLLLCDLAVEKVEQSKNVFKIMLDVSAYGEKEIDTIEDNSKQIDPLKEYLIMKKKENSNIIVNVALVMIHYIDKDPLKSFDYIIEAIKRAGSKEILNEIEMAKAMYFLKKRDVEKTIAILKSFENKNKKLISRVANNISFLYFVEGDANNAEKYANIALDNERYNHKALVNKGNIHFLKEDYLKSKEFYLEAIGVQSDCIEAIYNLGMVNIRMEAYYEAIQAFEKLNSVVPNIPEVLYKIARLYEYMKQSEEAIKYYSILLLHIPNDPILLSSLGSLYYQINVK
jgi:intraflagellar transport protein 88